jgi:protocatechuate 3,4-dioxygenase beta subunit
MMQDKIIIIMMMIKRSAVLLIGTLLLIFAHLGPSMYMSDQSAVAQNTNLLSSQSPSLPFDQLSAQQIATSSNKTCTLTPSLIEIEGTPQQIEGPYFIDGIPNRSDVRSETSDGSMQEGIPLQLIINTYDVGDDGLCIPFNGAKVDIWQANSQGIYSDVMDQGSEGKNFLRGYQIADDNGTVRFITIYPA